MGNWLDRKYSHLLSPHVRNYAEKSTQPLLINFSCPICGDSQTNERKARGYLYEEDDKVKYKCHNCGYSSGFSYFLKMVNQNLFKEYRLEKYVENAPKQQKIFGQIKTETKLRKKGIEKHFKALSAEALKYLEERKITKTEDIFFAEDFSVFKEFFPDKELPKDQRIIFPIRNRQREIVGINARAITPTKLRYVLLKYKENEPLIFNLDKVDISRKVFVVEGAIDSLFIDNAIAVNGSDLNKVFEIVPKKSGILIYDNQPKNKEIVKKMLASCASGYSMVIWPETLKGKDINDMVKLHGIEKVNSIIDENVYSGLACRAKIASWRKIN